VSERAALAWLDDELARVERASASLRQRIAATDAAIGARGVIRSFERLLAFEASIGERDLHGGRPPVG
jgi:hypothetical protein